MSSHNKKSLHAHLQTIKDDTTQLTGQLPTALSASGNLKISIEESSAGGDASLAEQQLQTTQLTTIAGDTTSLNSKVVACDTSSVTIASSALPSGAATEATLSALDAKVTAVDTSSVTIASSALPSGAATEATLALVATETTAAAPQYADGDTIAAADKGVLVMGKDNSGNAHPVRITANGDVECEIADFVKGQATMSASFPVVLASDQSDLNTKVNAVSNLGSYANLLNNSTLANGATSSAISAITDMSKCYVLVKDSSIASSDGYEIEVSPNNTDFFNVSSVYPISDGVNRQGYVQLETQGLTDIRVKNNSSTDTYNNVYVSVVGQPF